MAKRPLSALLAEAYPEASGKALYAAVLCGEVTAGGERVRDPSRRFPAGTPVEWSPPKYVSRGGYKLEGALDAWGIDPAGLVCLDAGASTGGFTDCLLSRGAALVHAVDVGFNQLAWKLRHDPRVLSRERCNLMDLAPGDLDPPPVLAVADLSFRSLRGAASRLLALCGGGEAVVLVKPQFEGAGGDGFDGVVRDDGRRRDAVLRLSDDLALEGVHVADAMASPVTGRKGNAELFFRIAAEAPADPDSAVRRIEAALGEAAQKSERPSGDPTRKPSPPR